MMKQLYWFGAGLLLVAVTLQVLLPDCFALKCPFFELFGIPCPTCGTTRALRCLFELKFRAAFLMQPLVFLLPIILLAGLVLLRLGNMRFGLPYLATVLVVFIINWAYLIRAH